ncbi:MAG: response regulator [Planctomycetota bacterium]
MTILIAEDDDPSRTLLERTLRSRGHDIIAVSDGEAALRYFLQPDAPHFAILDWNMPGLTGLEVCQQIRNIPASIPVYVILLTAQIESTRIVEALEKGANDYITKPFRRDELLARVQVGVRTVELHQELVRRVKELEEAAARERRLHELLPMCAWCRKIRSDDNYWNDLESYVKKSGVKITHGICPDCSTKVLTDWKNQAEQYLVSASH